MVPLLKPAIIPVISWIIMGSFQVGERILSIIEGGKIGLIVEIFGNHTVLLGKTKKYENIFDFLYFVSICK